MCLSDVNTWQSTLLSNDQRPIVTLFFYKIKDQIRELNYQETKYKIKAKAGDQKCNFAF